MANAFSFPDLPGYVNDSGNTADHATQMNASSGGRPGASADATAQTAMWTAWGMIIGALVLLWVLGWVFKGE
jgi:hypothetical protein